MLRYTFTRPTPSMSSICSAGPAAGTAARPFRAWNSRKKTCGFPCRKPRLISARVPAVPNGGPRCTATESFSTAPAAEPPGVGVGVAPRFLLPPPLLVLLGGGCGCCAGACAWPCAAGVEGPPDGGGAVAEGAAAVSTSMPVPSPVPAPAAGGCDCCCSGCCPLLPAVGVGTLIFSGTETTGGSAAVAGAASFSLGASEGKGAIVTTLSFLVSAPPVWPPPSSPPAPAPSSSPGAARLREAAAAAASAAVGGATARRMRGLAGTLLLLLLLEAPVPSASAAFSGGC